MTSRQKPTFAEFGGRPPKYYSPDPVFDAYNASVTTEQLLDELLAEEAGLAAEEAPVATSTTTPSKSTTSDD